MGFNYKPIIKVATANVGEFALSPVSITYGRINMLEPLGQTSCTFTLFRDSLDFFMNQDNVPIQEASLGATVIIESGSSTEYRRWFEGVITDISSSADTITFTAIDNAIFLLSKAPPYTLPNGETDADALIDLIVNSPTVGGLSVDTDISADFQIPVRTFGETATNLMTALQTVIGSVPTGFGWFEGPGTSAKGVLKIRTRNAAGDTPAISLSTTDIEKNYNITRSIGDITNEVIINYRAADESPLQSISQNLTSIEKIGARTVNREAWTYEDATIKSLEKGILAAGAPFGWPTIQFRVHGALLNDAMYELYDTFKVNNVIDTSTVVGADGFGKNMYIEQVTFNFEGADCTIDLLCSSEEYSTLPQIWSDVTSTLTWANVNNVFNNATWNDLLYVNL